MGSPPALDGEVIAGRYRLVEPIATGGSSRVYRAFDVNRQAFRAVKLLSPHLAANEKVRRRLLQEAEVMARLQHPNVVTLHEAGIDGDRVYLVMELMPGGSMVDRLEDGGPLPPRMAVRVLTGVLSALQLAHDAGIVHRDVKPHNILLSADGTPKVTDFGIARREAGELPGEPGGQPEAGFTRTGAVLGTLAYMPPEQKLSSRRVDLRADLYAAGATLYALLTGRPPHDLYAASLDSSIARELYAGIPPSLAEVVVRATAFRPDDRFASAAAMSAALAAAVGELPPDPKTPPLVTIERLGQSRALARLGPTLLGTTESAEGTTEIAQLPPFPPAPAPAPPAPGTPRWVVAVAVVLGAAALVASGWWLGRTVRQQATAAPTEAAAEVSQVAEPPLEARIRDAPGLPAPDGPPAPAELVQLVAPEPAPRAPRETAAAPAPEPASREVGRWKLEWMPSGRTRPDVTAILPADPVAAGDHRPVQPVLILRCRAGKPTVVLRTGIEDLTAAEDRIVLTVTTADGDELVGARFDRSLRGELLLQAPRSWMSRLLNEGTVRFVAEGRATTFTIGDASAVRDSLTDCL